MRDILILGLLPKLFSDPFLISESNTRKLNLIKRVFSNEALRQELKIRLRVFKLMIFVSHMLIIIPMLLWVAMQVN